MKFEIYKITNTINEKVYIGQTISGFYKRFQQHCKANSVLGRAIRKYGADNFTIEVLCVCETQEDANYFESYYIKENQSVIPNGYNNNEYGRLVGNAIYDFMIDFKPKFKKEIICKCTSVVFYYISKIFYHTNKNFVVMKNRQTPVKTWGELWDKIECTKRQTQQKIKTELLNNKIIIKGVDRFLINEDVCKIYY